jgi:hypothetical protein
MNVGLTIVGGISGLISLVCFVLVVIKIFQSGQTGLGIACILLLFCCGIGGLVAFIVGWMNAERWNIKNVMIIWTICFVVNIITGIMNPAPFQFQVNQQFR